LHSTGVFWLFEIDKRRRRTRNLFIPGQHSYTDDDDDDDDDDRLGRVSRAIVNVNARSWNDEVVVRTGDRGPRCHIRAQHQSL